MLFTFSSSGFTSCVGSSIAFSFSASLFSGSSLLSFVFDAFFVFTSSFGSSLAISSLTSTSFVTFFAFFSFGFTSCVLTLFSSFSTSFFVFFFCFLLQPFSNPYFILAIFIINSLSFSSIFFVSSS